MSGARATYEGSVTDPAVLHHLFRAQEGPVGQDLDRKAVLVEAQARRLCPVRTGRLVTTIRRDRGVGPLGQYVDVIAGREGSTPELGYVLYGTEPHIIRPSARKTLRFISGGRITFAREVHSRGTRPNPFLVRALDVLR